MSDPAPAETPPLALFLPSLAGGGAERAMLNLARGFRALGYPVDLVVGTAAGPYRGEVTGGVRLVDLGAGRVVHALPGLVRYLRRRRPQRLYAALDHANLIALAARRLAGLRLPVVISIRDTLSLAGCGQERDFRQRAVIALARRFYARAEGIVAVSEAAAADAAALLRLPQGTIRAIPNPVLTPDLPRLARAAANHPWLDEPGPPVILGAGRLVPQKDFSTLLRAFAQLRGCRPARLVILGEGPERGALEALAAELGIASETSFPGFVANPFAAMARAAAFALSSVHEGSPNVLVQALACGCAVVSTDCPSGPREICASLPQARLVPVRDPAAMAAALAAVMALPRPLPPAPLARFDYLAAARAYLAAGDG